MGRVMSKSQRNNQSNF